MMGKEYGGLLKELKKGGDGGSGEGKQNKSVKKPIFKITISMGDSDQMSDEDEDREEEGDDSPIIDSQDFI